MLSPVVALCHPLSRIVACIVVHCRPLSLTVATHTDNTGDSVRQRATVMVTMHDNFVGYNRDRTIARVREA